MSRRPVGTAGISVSSLVLGTMMFGPRGNTDPVECARMIEVAHDAGVTAFDTADVYTHGWAEEVLGTAVKKWRDEAVIVTKGGGKMGAGQDTRGASGRWLTRAIDGSLRRLKTDYVDIYLVHRPDPDTPLSETLEALTGFVRSGKARVVGCSTFPPHLISEARLLSERYGYEGFQCEQPPYSIFVRHGESEVFPLCRQLGMGVLVWGPLNHGWLTDRLPPAAGGAVTPRMRFLPHQHDVSLDGNRRKLAVRQKLSEIAHRAGCSLAQLAVAWTLTNPAVTAAVVGPRTVRQLNELLEAPRIRLEPDLLTHIDRIVPSGITLNEADGGYKLRARRTPSR